MDLSIKYIPNEVNNWEVTRAIALVLHSPDFAPIDDERRLINFRVKLNDNPAGGVRNDGTGTLTLPTEQIGHKFLMYISSVPIKIKSRKLRFTKNAKPPPPGLLETLRKTPYINPDIEEERQSKIRALEDKLRVDAVQFGLFFQPNYPRTTEERLSPRAFSIESQKEYISDSIAWLSFDYDHKLIRITLGNELIEYEGYNLAISFTSIRKIGVGYDGSPYICFDTLTPPVMEAIQFHRPESGDREVDNRKYKYRVGSINEAHAIVAPYCPHVRLVLYNQQNTDVIANFVKMCEISGLPSNMIIRCRPGLAWQIEAVQKGFFKPKRLYELHRTLGRFDWRIAFQLESLLHNGLLHTGDIDGLLPRVRGMVDSGRAPGFIGHLLRKYNEALQVRPVRESPAKCFQTVCDEFKYTPPNGVDIFRCYHVTFTPTRMILEGPYASQSNRVIRRYEGYEDHFLRVDFRDEDRLQYRWDRAVDGVPFLTERVGRTLKEGFSLAGRCFEFLAYSSSALREHAVWFMNPFYHAEKGVHVNSAYIRDSLGHFKGTDLLRMPSKYAARLAQAFTATDPSVDIHRHEWELVPDLGQEPYLFTDGVGSISKKLGDRIWAKLCEKKRNREHHLQPWAYQIRFLGFKGVVNVNPYLDERTDGIQMQLRPSMGKFETKEADSQVAPLEIAQAFEQPNPCYLNRPLIMLLEDLAVRQVAFQELQDLAVADAKTMDDSISQFCKVLSAHRLGSAFKLRDILTRLQEKYKMDLSSNNGRTIAIDNPFLKQLRQVAMTDILRDIKHGARIPVPDSYLLVGVADEGPAYLGKPGFEDVYCLDAGQIYACIERPGDAEPTWIEGLVSISRSPVAHVGDVQLVQAIGKPPPGRICMFAHLRNCVVMASVGPRSLASCLGGGDVDGDMFSVMCHGSILPRSTEPAANYEGLPTKDLKRDSTVEDICDFVVEYIHSDLLGLLSDRLLVIADQSMLGMHDPSCMYLAELCSQAVDYPKQGTAPHIDNDSLPPTLIRCKPDWHAAEVVSPRHTDYYESSKALGVLFRAIQMDQDPIEQITVPPISLLNDPISVAILRDIEPYLGSSARFVENHPPDLISTFRYYVDELRYICATHTLSNTPGIRLLETEIVIGTILAKCTQARWRRERMYRMRLHAQTLVADIHKSLLEDKGAASPPELVKSLRLSWNAWDFCLRNRNQFGAQSFGLIALGVIFECLDELKARPIDAEA